MGEILTKTCFSPQTEQHTAKLCFSVILAFLGKFRELLFLVQKWAISERSTEILRKLFFLNMFEREYTEENLDWFKQIFLTKPVK